MCVCVCVCVCVCARARACVCVYFFFFFFFFFFFLSCVSSVRSLCQDQIDLAPLAATPKKRSSPRSVDLTTPTLITVSLLQTNKMSLKYRGNHYCEMFP